LITPRQGERQKESKYLKVRELKREMLNRGKGKRKRGRLVGKRHLTPPN